MNTLARLVQDELDSPGDLARTYAFGRGGGGSATGQTSASVRAAGGLQSEQGLALHQTLNAHRTAIKLLVAAYDDAIRAPGTESLRRLAKRGERGRGKAFWQATSEHEASDWLPLLVRDLRAHRDVLGHLAAALGVRARLADEAITVRVSECNSVDEAATLLEEAVAAERDVLMALAHRVDAVLARRADGGP
jgi:hypothetical protein